VLDGALECNCSAQGQVDACRIECLEKVSIRIKTNRKHTGRVPGKAASRTATAELGEAP